jgi:mannose-6-phosphate isomerase-like protein (cupin superfamily)
MIIKKRTDHISSETKCCGNLSEILTKRDDKFVGVAIAVNIQPTLPHFHMSFDEIYLVLDGMITLDLYDPNHQTYLACDLGANELCIITRGIHHRISKSSNTNRLCVITNPAFQADDEHPSDKFIQSVN